MFNEPEDFIEEYSSNKMERIDSLEDMFLEPEVRHAKNAGVSVAPEKPAKPKSGDFWMDTTTGTSYVYYEDYNDSQWLPIGGSAK